MTVVFYPTAIEKTGRGTKTIDLPSKLLEQRKVYVNGEINQTLIDSVILQLLWLNSQDPESDIDLYINSRGGSVEQGLALRDIIDILDCKVNTIGFGGCMSMGAYLLGAGTGVRQVLPNTRVMIHPVSAGVMGDFPAMKAHFDEINHTNETMFEHISQFTKGKQTPEDVKNACKEDYYMSAQEALDFGLIDKIFTGE